MAIDSINFSISLAGDVQQKKETVLQRTNREKTYQNQGKANLDINEKQKKHVKTRK